LYGTHNYIEIVDFMKFIIMKKFTLVAAFAALALATTASAVTLADFGNSTIKVGSRGPAVVAVQTALNACIGGNLSTDGIFGPKTAMDFKAFQTSKGLVADGLVGNLTKAMLVACSTPASTTTTTTTTTTTNGGTTTTSDSTLNGGAGSIDVTATTANVESNVAEGKSENVLGLKIKADGSDVSLVSLKFTVENVANTNGGGLASVKGSSKVSKFVDNFKVMLGTEEVGSIDAADLTKDGTLYKGSVSLDEAIVRDEKEGKLFIVAEALDTVDETDATLEVEVTQVRYEDAEGVVSTETGGDLPHSDTFGFDAAGADDDMSIKASSANPNSATLKVDENDTSDEYLVLAYKLDVDDKSSDVTVNTFDISMLIADAGAAVNDPEAIFDEVRVEVGGEDYIADLETESVTAGAGTAVYRVDTDEDLVIESGDMAEVKVYVTFNDQDGNYDAGTTIKATANGGSSMDVEAEDTLTVSGSASGKIHTLATNAPVMTLVSKSLSLQQSIDGVGAGFEDIFVAKFVVDVKAGDDDIYLPLNTFTYGTTGAAGVEYSVSGAAPVTSAVLEADDSDIEETNSYKVDAGSTERFTFSVFLTGNNTSNSVAINSFWYELSDTAPNGTPEMTSGLSTFKTTSTYLAK